MQGKCLQLNQNAHLRTNRGYSSIVVSSVLYVCIDRICMWVSTVFRNLASLKSGSGVADMKGGGGAKHSLWGLCRSFRNIQRCRCKLSCLNSDLKVVREEERERGGRALVCVCQRAKERERGRKGREEMSGQVTCRRHAEELAQLLAVVSWPADSRHRKVSK